MKFLPFLLFLLLPIFALAQVNQQQLQQQILNQIQNMDMQELQQQAVDIQRCLNVDQERLNQLAQEGQRVGERIKALCQNGERQKAQQLAMAESKRFKEDPIIRKISQCSNSLVQKMRGNMDDWIDDKKHVCDHSW
jgi:hypothetical protein